MLLLAVMLYVNSCCSCLALVRGLFWLSLQTEWMCLPQSIPGKIVPDWYSKPQLQQCLVPFLLHLRNIEIAILHYFHHIYFLFPVFAFFFFFFKTSWSFCLILRVRAVRKAVRYRYRHHSVQLHITNGIFVWKIYLCCSS